MNVYEAIRDRRSVRSYSNKPIPEQVLKRLRQVLRWAPSAGNKQPWQFILVQDQQLRQELAAVANKQSWMADAPLNVVGCAYLDKGFKHMAGRHNASAIDVTIALDHLSLAAAAEGLGTCWIGAFDEPKAKKLLSVPDPVRIVAMMPVGYPTSADLIRPIDESRRKPESEIFSIDRFDNPAAS